VLEAKIITIRPFGESNAKPRAGSTDKSAIIGTSPTQLCCWLCAAFAGVKLANATIAKPAKTTSTVNHLPAADRGVGAAQCRDWVGWGRICVLIIIACFQKSVCVRLCAPDKLSHDTASVGNADNRNLTGPIAQSF